MPYSIRERDCTDSEGNDGNYVVVKDETGESVGCHQSRSSAEDQIAAIHANKSIGMERLVRPIEFKSVSEEEEGTFVGYASIFGTPDQSGETAVKGLFRKSLDASGHKFPLHVDHDLQVTSLIGVAEVYEDEVGLRTKGYINMDKQIGREIYSDMKHAQKHGLNMGMSFGYKVPKGGRQYKSGGKTDLVEADLKEITVTQWPMHTGATVTDVKSQIDTFSNEQLLFLIDLFQKAVHEQEEEEMFNDEVSWLDYLNDHMIEL